MEFYQNKIVDDFCDRFFRLIMSYFVRDCVVATRWSIFDCLSFICISVLALNILGRWSIILLFLWRDKANEQKKWLKQMNVCCFLRRWNDHRDHVLFFWSVSIAIDAWIAENMRLDRIAHHTDEQLNLEQQFSVFKLFFSCLFSSFRLFSSAKKTFSRDFALMRKSTEFETIFQEKIHELRSRMFKLRWSFRSFLSLSVFGLKLIFDFNFARNRSDRHAQFFLVYFKQNQKFRLIY